MVFLAFQLVVSCCNFSFLSGLQFSLVSCSFVISSLCIYIKYSSALVLFVSLLGGAVKGVTAQVHGVLQASAGEPPPCRQDCPASGMMI